MSTAQHETVDTLNVVVQDASKHNLGLVPNTVKCRAFDLQIAHFDALSEKMMSLGKECCLGGLEYVKFYWMNYSRSSKLTNAFRVMYLGSLAWQSIPHWAPRS